MLLKLMRQLTATLIAKVITSANNNKSSSHNNFSDISRKINSNPIKLFAAFFMAPVLLVKIVIKVKNPWRRFIAVTGISIGIIGAYIAGTLAGTAVMAFLVGIKIGLIYGAAFFIGAGVTVFVTVVCQIVVLNTICFIFLKMSTQEIVDYLDELSS